MPSETLNTGFRRHLFTVELSPSGGEVFQSMMDGTDMYNYSLNPHVVGRFFRDYKQQSTTLTYTGLNPHVVGRFFRVNPKSMV